MRGTLSAFLAVVCLSAFVQAITPDVLRARKPSIPRKTDHKRVGGPVMSRNGTRLPPLSTVYYFDQLVDHDDATKGTFKQRYWSTWEFYEPGGPIVLMTPGESNADGFYADYLGNGSINGMIAQQQNGSTVLLEHRFFGESNPTNNLSAASLALLNIDQSSKDLVYFAENVKLPMPGGDAVSPKQAPWVLVGGSYAGALTAWTKVASPDTFYAAYASSAVVEAINDFWQYFQPVRENMPTNCSADVEAVITHVDSILTGSNQTAINETKALFGLGNLTHLDDFASALRNPLFLWQSLQPTDGAQEGDFFLFCDALEMKNGTAAPAEGWGLDYTLAAWGKYSTDQLVPNQCGNTDVETCLGTYDAKSDFYTNTTVNNDLRSWYWFVCNEVGWYQEGAPDGTPSIVSRTLGADYDARLCTYYFPEKFSTTPTANTDVTNTKYGGWTINQPRLFFANGKRDPWREATMSAETQNVASTESQPIAIGDGYHCSDLLLIFADETILAVQKQALAFMNTWLAGWSAPA